MRHLLVFLLITTMIFIAGCSIRENRNSVTSTTDQPVNAPAGSAATSATAAQEAPAAEVVRVSAAPTELRAGEAAEATLRIVIADGLHINANPPTYSYLKATELTAGPTVGVVIAGRPVYPAVTKKFAFAEKPLAVYEGEAAIKLPLRATRAAQKGASTLSAKLRVQPCDDEKCFPPRTIETSIPVVIK